MDVEPRLLAMVATVAGYSQRKDGGAARKVKNFRAVELNELRRVFVFASARDDDSIVLRFVVRPCRPDARRKLPFNAFCLRCRTSEKRYGGSSKNGELSPLAPDSPSSMSPWCWVARRTLSRLSDGACPRRRHLEGHIVDDISAFDVLDLRGGHWALAILLPLTNFAFLACSPLRARALWQSQPLPASLTVILECFA